jgi:hypothetical protein
VPISTRRTVKRATIFVPCVLSAQAGIQFFLLYSTENLDAGFHRHDGTAFKLEQNTRTGNDLYLSVHPG